MKLLPEGDVKIPRVMLEETNASKGAEKSFSLPSPQMFALKQRQLLLWGV